MAKLGDMTIRLDRGLTATKVRMCANVGCKHHSLKLGSMDCNLKWIDIGDDWKCRQFEHRNKDKSIKRDKG